MSSNPPALPNGERRQVRRFFQFLYTVATLATFQALASYRSSFDKDAGQNMEEERVVYISGMMDRLNTMAALNQILTGQSENAQIAEIRIALLSERAGTAESRFQRLGIVKDIDEAIKDRSQAVSLTPEGLEDRATRLAELGTAFTRRFQGIRDLADLNNAVKYLSQGVQLMPEWNDAKLNVLYNLVLAYDCRYERLGELADLDKAIKYKTQGLLLAPEGHPERPIWLDELGSSYWSRFDKLGELADVNRAIEYCTRALLLTPGEHVDKPSRLNHLGNSYQSKFDRLGELADLNKAIEHKAQAVQLTPDGNPHKPIWLNNLGISYFSRFERLGKLPDLNKSIDYTSQAALLPSDKNNAKPSFLNNLGNSYRSRFGQLGELPDLEKSINYSTQAVSLTPDGDADKPARLSNLGISYEARFRRLGELADVNKAIEYISRAVQLTPDGHLDKPSWLSNLATSYASRFDRLGELSDLNKGIEYQTRAGELTPDGHADKPPMLNNLGNLHDARFRRLGELPDLDKAIKYKTNAVLLTPNEHAGMPRWLNNLAISYQSRFKRLGELEDVDKAIEFLTQAMQLTPDGHTDKPRFLSNLAISYQFRFARLLKVSDGNTAVAYQSQAIALTPDGHAFKPKMFYELGCTYRSRYMQLHNLSDLELAVSSFQNGAQLTLTHPKAQSQCAQGWALSCLLLGVSPQAAYERCIELIPHLIWLGTTIDQRYTLLREISDLATQAAAWAISNNAFDLALEWLEAGRSIVWNQILQLRTPFDDLASVAPSLAQGLKYTASKLEAVGSRQSAPLSHDAPSSLEEGTQHHHHLAIKWEQLLGEARAIPGFQNFLRPRKANELLHSATDGPVVVLNVHSFRCDALIIFPGSDDIAHLSLSHTSLAELREAHIQLQSLVGHRGDRKGGFKRSDPSPKPEDSFKSILAACWSDVVQPVLGLLTQKYNLQLVQLPHVTWCTTGALSFLPLHAAGLYDGSQPNAPDLIVSSYTPTLSALLPTNPLGTSSHVGVLAVGQEHTPGFFPLPSTVLELEIIQECAKGTRFQQLDRTLATVDAVLGAMESHTWVHLACHASQNLDDPTQSAFHLHDGSLTLETITKRSFKNKGLAFLSACQTATGDVKLADEAVHLAAGMLMAGYPSVIATLWSIQDEDGPKIAEVVYADLLKGGRADHRKAARALHKAVLELREKVGDDAFERWVPFIHIGV